MNGELERIELLHYPLADNHAQIGIIAHARDPACNAI
jgi:hypothetical protein